MMILDKIEENKSVSRGKHDNLSHINSDKKRATLILSLSNSMTELWFPTAKL